MKIGDYPESPYDSTLAPFFKYSAGSNVVRLIPDVNNEEMAPIRVHWIGSRPHACTNFNRDTGKFDNKSCEYCKANIDANKADCAVALNKDLEVVLLPLKKSIIEDIGKISVLMTKMGKFSSPDDFNSLTNGIWLNVKKSGSGLNTKYSTELYDGDELPEDVTPYLEDVDVPDLATLYPAEDTDAQLEVVMGAAVKEGNDVLGGKDSKAVNVSDLAAVGEDDSEIPY